MFQFLPILGPLFIFLMSIEGEVSINSYAVQSLTEDTISDQVSALLKRMTLREKIGQLNQYSSFNYTGPSDEDKKGNQYPKSKHLRSGWVGAVLNVHGTEKVRELQRIAVEETRLGIPLLFGFDVIHGYKSISPIPFAEAASWDLEAIQRSAEIAAEEASSAGINWTFAPMVDITRDPRWGRVMEGAGEDPFLGSQIAKARVRGFQGGDLSSPKTLAACAKHFAAYGFVEGGREYNTSDISANTLYNFVLPPFKAAVDAGVKSIMSGFQILNGIPVSANKFLQRELLKEEWDFPGFVVSDWGTIKEMKIHGYTSNHQVAVLKAISAGLDMEMESRLFIKHLAGLVEEGRLDESLIDQAAARILRVKFELGLFKDPYRYCDEERESNTIKSSRFHSDLLDIAQKSVVLLKNEDDVLPLSKTGLKLAVIGPLANDKTSPLGNWRLAADEEQAVSLWEGLSRYKSDNTLRLAAGVNLIDQSPAFSQMAEIDYSDRSDLPNAIREARNADVVILALGEHGMMSGEGRSRGQLGLPGLQDELLEAVYAVNKNIILVLNTGRPLVLTDIEPKVKAILVGWHLGDHHGTALTNILYGEVNPSGKLPMSFPKDRGQIPVYYNHFNTGRPNQSRPGEVFWSHYNDMDRDPLYPFGYGLSYSEFSYSDIEIEQGNENSNGLAISATISNTSKTAGREVAQCYLKSHYADVVQPVRALKGFQSVYLAPGESQVISFEISPEDLGYYDNRGQWIQDSGELTFYIGTNSKAKLSKTITLENSSASQLLKHNKNHNR